MVSNLALFCLASYLATLKKIGQFFSNHLVTLSGSHCSVPVAVIAWTSSTDSWLVLHQEPG